MLHFKKSDILVCVFVDCEGVEIPLPLLLLPLRLFHLLLYPFLSYYIYFYTNNNDFNQKKLRLAEAILAITNPQA
jgi:hypothetical protein